MAEKERDQKQAPPRQTMQQRRAAFALQRVRQAAENPKIKHKEYRSHAASLPAMIHINGLGQTAAFCLQKGETYKVLYDLLSDWLTQPGQPYHGRQDLITGITTCDMHRYRLAQAEAIVLLDWVKRFAKALMPDD